MAALRPFRRPLDAGFQRPPLAALAHELWTTPATTSTFGAIQRQRVARARRRH